MGSKFLPNADSWETHWNYMYIHTYTHEMVFNWVTDCNNESMFI